MKTATRQKPIIVVSFTACVATALAQSNIDDTVPDKHAWSENVGWTNWRDAGATPGDAGAFVGPFFMSGFIWTENGGWINLGDGSPGGECDGLPCYANVDGSDFGVNIDASGLLHGMAWGEAFGWINFDGGALATPPQSARVLCADPPAEPRARLTGYVWGEVIGWINLSEQTATHYVALSSDATPVRCDLNEDGAANGLDIQLLVDLILGAGTPTWRDLCAGDVGEPANSEIDLGDISGFLACLLGAA